MVFYQHPLVLMILFLFVAAIVIKQSVAKHKILKNRLFISFFFIFALAMCCVFYKEIKAIDLLYNILNYVYLGLDACVAIFFFLSVDYSMEKDNFYKEIVSSIDDNKIYVLVDKKERVKQISTYFANILGKTKDECVKKKISTLMDSSLRVSAYNSEEINNQYLWQTYSDYSTGAVSGTKTTIELMVEDRDGKEFALAIIETPIFAMNKYRGRLWFGDKVSEENLIGMEKTIVDSNRQLDSLTSRFVSLLECTKEAIFFVDLEEQSIWCNDQMVNLLNLEGNSLAIEDYRRFISKQDRPFYDAKVAHLSEKEPTYDLTYRYSTGGRDIFVKERAKLCITKSGREICGIIERIPDVHFEHTEIPELDTIRNEDNLIVDATKFENENKAYLIAVFNLDTIPQINEEHGRGFGNMVMAEYVRMIHKNFVNDNQIYRIGGLRFAAIVSDLRKMEILKNRLAQKESILHASGTYGALEFRLDVTMGLAYHKDAGTAKGVYKNATAALQFVQKPQVTTNYVYYQDLK